jgi:hypothetical protein
VEEESGPAGWITAALPIDAVLAAYVEHPIVVWLDRRKLTRHKRDSLSTAAEPIASHSPNDTMEADLASQISIKKILLRRILRPSPFVF